MAFRDSLLWRLALLLAFDESFPRLSLLFPTRHDRNCTNLAFAEAWDVIGAGFEVDDRLLDVGGEIGQVDDLRYAGAGDAGDTGDFSLVFDLASGSRCSSRIAIAISLVM